MTAWWIISLYMINSWYHILWDWSYMHTLYWICRQYKIKISWDSKDVIFLSSLCSLFREKVEIGVDKVKKYSVLTVNKKTILTKSDCESYQKQTLISKLWSIMYNYHLGTLSTELIEPLLDSKINMIIDGQHRNKSLRIYKVTKHFKFNSTTYLIMDKEDRSLHENYRQASTKFTWKRIEQILQ
jgi:hypothetical protein